MATFPRLHLNGSSAEALLAPLMKARSATRDALAALTATGPHGRDYYVQGEGALGAAGDEHWERLRKLEAVLGELDAQIRNIMQQDEARRAR